MSPIGGVGINLAIQDAVAAANLLAGPLRRRPGKGRRSSGRRGAAHPACTLYAVAAAHHPEADHQPRSGKPATAEAAAVLQALWHLSGSAPHSGPIDRGRYSSRARAHARSCTRLLRFSHHLARAFSVSETRDVGVVLASTSAGNAAQIVKPPRDPRQFPLSSQTIN